MMHLDAAKPVVPNRNFDHRVDAPAISLRVDEGKSVEAIRTPGDDSRHLTVGDGIVRVKSGEQHRAIDPGFSSALEIRLE